MKRSPLKTSLPFILLAVALVIYWSVNPMRLEHVVLLVVFAVLCAVSRVSRDLAITLVPAAIFGFTYDLMGLFAERSYDEVIIEPVYRAEELLFGWMAPGELGPVDFFRDHHSVVLDVLAGLLYSTHVPSVIVFGIFLWWLCRRSDAEDGDRRVHPFMWGYLAMNLIGFVIWVLFPVAPPWYVEQYGFQPPGEAIPGDPAALARVDVLLGYDHFRGIYEQATYVFGAFPSMHVAPTVWIALWARRPSIRIVASLYAGLMSFFAVYLTHHYIIDVVAGALLAAFLYWVMSRTRARGWAERLAHALRRSVDALFESRAPEAPAE